MLIQFIFVMKVNYHPQSGWLDFKPLKGGEKQKARQYQ
jgi:hypothetical protein